MPASATPDAPADGGRGVISVGLAFAAWALAWVALNVVGGILAGAVTVEGEDPPIWLVATLQLLGAVIFAGALVFASLRKHRHDRTVPLGVAELRADYRLWFVPKDLAALPLGVLTQLLLVPLLYLPLRELWPATFNDDALTETAEGLVERAGNGATLALLFVTVCVVAPVIEELVYRGLLQGALMRRLGRVAGWCAASALFALIHFRPVEYPGLLVAGLVFGACLALTGRLGPAILAHAAFNLTGLLFAL